MIGYPKILSTSADVVNLLAVEAYKGRVLADLQALLDERYGWILTGKLLDAAAGNTSPGHKVVEVENKDATGQGIAEWYQYTWGVQDSTALNRMGVTVEDAVAWGCVDRVIAPPTEG